MSLTRAFRDEPLTAVAATVLMGTGVACGFLVSSWAGPTGTALAALGGALLSYVTTRSGARETAVALLGPEIQSTTRHLADTASKLSRDIQLYQQSGLEAELVIDRVTQMRSSIYGAVTDLNILLGEAPDFESLANTVSACEEAARIVEALVTEGVDPKKEVADLAAQLEKAKTQLEALSLGQKGSGPSAVEGLVGIPRVARSIERVLCPECQCEAQVPLGRVRGDSGTANCPKCGARFHVHRDASGGVFIRRWGTPSAPAQRLTVQCPVCHDTFTMNFDANLDQEIRACFRCDSEVRISRDGTVVAEGRVPVYQVQVAGFVGTRPVLRCPSCGRDYIALWTDGARSRAFCKACKGLLECRATHDAAHAEAPDAAVASTPSPVPGPTEPDPPAGDGLAS